MAMDEVTYVRKDRKQGMKYTIVSHDVVTAKVRPALLNVGIIYHPTQCTHVQNGNRAECSMVIRFVNIDDPKDYFEVPSFGYGIDAQDKGPGKAMSYAVKYALLKAMGLETGDDPDHDDVNHSQDNAPPFDPGAARDRIKASVEKCTTLDDLKAAWQSDYKTVVEIGATNQPMKLELEKAKDDKKNELGAAEMNQGAG